MASKIQVEKIARLIVDNQDLLEAISNNDARWAIDNPKALMQLLVEAIITRKNEPVVEPKRVVIRPKLERISRIARPDRGVQPNGFWDITPPNIEEGSQIG